MPAESSNRPRGAPLRAARRVLPWIALAAVAGAARLASWAKVFVDGGVRFLADTDTHYHVLGARRILERFPRFAAFDPNLNYPDGARLPWPPLFDYVLALPARLLGGSPETLERVAAFVPPVLGTATVLLVAWAGARLADRRTGLTAGLLLALTPAHVAYTILGRPDQHALETLLSTAAFAAFAFAIGPGRRWPAAVALGASLALSFWNWQGSGLYPVVLGTFAALWHVVAAEPGDDRVAAALARGAAAGAVVLAGSLLAFAPAQLRDLGGRGVTGLHVLLLAVTATFAALVHAAARLRRGAGQARRAFVVAAAAALAAALPLLVPAVRAGVVTNLSALAAGNRWYEGIGEFQPLLGQSGEGLAGELGVVTDTFGFALLLLPLALPALVTAWRSRAQERARLAFLATSCVTLVAFTLFRRRFQLYSCVPIALSLSLALRDLARRLARRTHLRAGVLARALPFAASLAITFPVHHVLGGMNPGRGVVELRPALDSLRSQPQRPGREAVLADWDLGHLVQYFAARPVIVSPFGVEGGDGAMEAAARFYLAADETHAEEALRSRRVGFVLVLDPLNDAYMFAPFTPLEGVEPVRLVQRDARSTRYDASEVFWRSPLARLYFADGSDSVAGPALGGFRLLSETPPDNPGPPALGAYKLFGFVPGAHVVISGATPGATVVASIALLTNAGRARLWTTSAVADAGGVARVRVPFATGRNGLVTAGSCSVTDGVRGATAAISDDQVESGAAVEVRVHDAIASPIVQRNRPHAHR